MIFVDKEPFNRLSDELSRMKCPYCGKFHEVNFSFQGEVVTYSASHGCDGFKVLVNNRLNKLPSLEMNRLLREL